MSSRIWNPNVLAAMAAMATGLQDEPHLEKV